MQAWWEESIRVLGDFHFLDALLLYDKDAMTEEMTLEVCRTHTHTNAHTRAHTYTVVAHMPSIRTIRNTLTAVTT